MDGLDWIELDLWVGRGIDNLAVLISAQILQDSKRHMARVWEYHSKCFNILNSCFNRHWFRQTVS